VANWLFSFDNRGPPSVIRWKGIQHILEEASSDVLVIMDSAYYPGEKPHRQEGVLEVVAAAAREDHAKIIKRGEFTRILANELRIRAVQKFNSPFSAAGLHAKMLSRYRELVLDRCPESEKETVTSFPAPLHIQVSRNPHLPSILLAPIVKEIPPCSPESPTGGAHMSMAFRLSEDTINKEKWAEWLRLMPEGVKEVKVEGPYRNTFQ